MQEAKIPIIIKKIEATLHDLKNEPSLFQDDNLILELVHAVVEANEAMLTEEID